MPEIIVVGSGVVGMCGAMMLARDGHRVTVLERDSAAPPSDPDAAWRDWERRGVSQFRMIHLLLARFRREIERELPEVIQKLDEFSALRMHLLDGLPDEFTGGRLVDDDRFELITARRPVVEAAVASVAGSTPGLTVRRGVAVAGLMTSEDPASAVPHVIGVRTEDGEEIIADLVVDASGRRSRLGTWLGSLGVTASEVAADSGFIYYGRHFQSGDGSLPNTYSGSLLHEFDSMSILTLPGDNGTWGVAIIAAASDKALRATTDAEIWSRVVSHYPGARPWLEGQPILDDVQVMAKIEDRVRNLVVDGRPVVTGVVALGDSWASTNPSVGRGISIGVMHAAVLRDTLGSTGLNDATGFATAFHEQAERDVAPYVEDTLELSRHRLAQMHCQIDSEPYEPDDPGFQFGRALNAGARNDPHLLRCFLDVANLLDRGVNVLGRPGIVERVMAVDPTEASSDAPTRSDLLDLLTV